MFWLLEPIWTSIIAPGTSSVPHFENMARPQDESFWASGIYVDLREY
jgi:hypothetical protein